ncbi:MAG: FmdE family protein [Flavobacteriaceae bacterium]|jgi:pyrimidine-specific ribonucleoside hydrolase|nr:FmdE family protein [Flavobacteriaceae bacterium]
MIFKIFPEDPDFYSEEIRPIVKQTIERHGMEEWQVAVTTHELHGHMGIYSILGVKMGMAALDYLKVKKGSLIIYSEAGTNPPVSCMNDGLQVSTGATFGHGQIISNPTKNPKAAACFKYKNTTLHVKPKEEIENKLKKEITEAIEKFGHSPQYWNHIKNLALTCWLEWDRSQIFEVQEFDAENHISYKLFH